MFIWLGGLLFAKNVMHLMLAHICEQQFSPLRRTFITVLVVATWLGCVFLIRFPLRFHRVGSASIVLLSCFNLVMFLACVPPYSAGLVCYKCGS